MASPLEGVTVNVNGVDEDVTDEYGRYIVTGFGPKKDKDKKDAMIVTFLKAKD